jgi:U8 snoRNA-decapping enzyme
MRFDGTLGFPGGFIDPGESVLDCLNREMKEEICLDLAKFAVKKDDFVAMQVLDKKDEKFGQVYNKIHLYFFIKEVDEESFLKIEEDSRKAEHFGTEVQSYILCINV